MELFLWSVINSLSGVKRCLLTTPQEKSHDKEKLQIFAPNSSFLMSVKLMPKYTAKYLTLKHPGDIPSHNWRMRWRQWWSEHHKILTLKLWETLRKTKEAPDPLSLQEIKTKGEMYTSIILYQNTQKNFIPYFYVLQCGCHWDMFGWLVLFFLFLTFFKSIKHESIVSHHFPLLLSPTPPMTPLLPLKLITSS